MMWKYKIEKIENGESSEGSWEDSKPAEAISTLRDIITYICWVIEVDKFNEGVITEIKATRDKDGSILVCVTGNRDRIFAKVVSV